MYWTLVPTNRSNGTLKKYKELLQKMRNIIKLITNRSENYDYYFPLKKTLKLGEIVIAVRSVFHEDSKFYLPFFYKNLILNPCTTKNL